MTARSLMKWLVPAAVTCTLALAVVTYYARAERSDARYAAVRPDVLAKGLHVAGVVLRMSDCQGCKQDRAKQGLPPMEKVVLPKAITTNSNFRRPAIKTFVCPVCDGETLVTSALRTHKQRQST